MFPRSRYALAAPALILALPAGPAAGWQHGPDVSRPFAAACAMDRRRETLEAGWGHAR